MDTEAERALRGMVRAGTVSSVNPANSTARVEFDDKDGTVSPELHIIHRGSGANKDYWLPDVGEQVVCLFANNDKNFSTGWILGTYFTEKKPPQVNNQDIRRLDFSDGTFSWGIDGNFFAGPKLGDMPEVRGDSPLRPLILSFLVTGEKNNGHFRDIMQIFWLTVLFFGGVGELFLLKRIKEGGAVDDPSFQVMALSLLSILGLMMFELLFEAKARYLFTYLPVFLIPGVYGAVSLFRILRRRLSS